MNAIILIAFGVAGVGKSSTISKFVEDRPDFVHLVASQLIRNEMLGMEIDSPTSLSAARAQVAARQKALIAALGRAKEQLCSSLVILDGHCVIDLGAELYRVPTRVVQQIGPAHIVFFYDDPAAIYERRKGDTKRSRPLLSEVTINHQQAVAIDTCRGYASTLGIPLTILKSGAIDELEQIVVSLINSRGE